MTADAPQRPHRLREVFNGLRWLVRAGAPWRMMPNALPPWEAVSHQTPRWLRAGVFEALGHDWRRLVRLREGRRAPPSAAMLERRPLPARPASGRRAGDAGAQRTRGSKVPRAGDPLGHVLALQVTPAHDQDRAQVAQVAEPGQEVTAASVEGALVAQGSTGERPRQDAADQGRPLAGVNLPEAQQGFGLRPRRWVVERSVGWAARFRRLARDDERWPGTLAGLHVLAFAILMLARVVALMVQSA